jgi:hypothetical protein
VSTTGEGVVASSVVALGSVFMESENLNAKSVGGPVSVSMEGRNLGAKSVVEQSAVPMEREKVYARTVLDPRSAFMDGRNMDVCCVVWGLAFASIRNEGLNAGHVWARASVLMERKNLNASCALVLLSVFT